MARLVTVLGFLIFTIINVAMSITVQEFFPDVKNNLTKIKWAHRTNSQADLTAALASNEVMMIEADVIIGNLTTAGEGTINIPIMGHPPNKTGDLSLSSFVNQVTNNKKKGIKLDFKSLEAVEKGVIVLQELKNITVPVWLNADILKGPVNAVEPGPVDPKGFLAAAAKLPQSLLSIGWTTRLEETSQNVTNGKYTSEQINEMVKTVQDSKTNQSVTYPVRACYASNDGDVLKTLLTNTKSTNPTLTIWSSEGDKVDPAKLSEVIKSIGIERVYVDVPSTLWNKLNLTNSAFTAKSSMSVIIASIILGLSACKFL